jgi:Tol biopolymer transport system component
LVDSRKIKTAPGLSEKDRLETYPTWSPDGKYLYYCSAPILWTDRNTVPPEHYEEVRYDLMRIGYNAESDEWGQPETVLSAKETELSILCPRISPDGRFLVFCMSRYGCFPVYQPSSDLYMMDLKTGKYEKLPINSEFSESWHSFSSNSRWLTFSSKRPNGLFTRTYFSYIDETGRAYKPFILPQEDPAYYDSLLQTYSTPELIKHPVKVGKRALAWAARGPANISPDVPITGATPKTIAEDPWQNRE